MLQINKISYKSEVSLIILFLVALTYMFLMTDGVPFFWDDHEYHNGYIEQSYFDLIERAVWETGRSLNTSRPIYGIFIKGLFDVFGLDYSLFRFLKSIIFAFVILLVGYLCLKFIEDKISLLSIPLILMFTFPLYLHTFVFDEPWIIGIFFILIAIVLFLKDYSKGKTSVLQQVFILIFCWLAFRTYSSSMAIIGLFFFFILITDYKKFQRYGILLITLILLSFPILPLLISNESLISSLPFKLNLHIFKKAFLHENSFNFILSPFPKFSDLYYLPLISIIGFFGFWLIIFIFILFSLSRLLPPISFSIFQKFPFQDKTFLKFAAIWFLCELPVWIVLPEYAVRYASGTLIPFFLFLGIIFLNIFRILSLNYKKIFTCVSIIIIVLVILTNLSYTVLFRATWGSAFIVYEKVTLFLEKIRDKNSLILYNACSVASEYIPLTSYGEKEYKIDYESYPRRYRKECSPSKFSEKEIQRLKNEFSEIYILKRTSSFFQNSFPEIDFEKYPAIKLIKIFEGTNKSLFDRTFIYLASLFKINYQPNKVFVYKNGPYP